MINKRSVLGALAALVPASVAAAKLAPKSSGFPSVPELQNQLNLFPGRPFPKLIVFEGRAYEAYYEGARYVGDGVYEARVRAKNVTT